MLTSCYPNDRIRREALDGVKASTDEGPVAQISHRIYHQGAKEMQLSTMPEDETVEFTATDIGLILKTLWLCTDLITFLFSIQRVIFHALVLLFQPRLPTRHYYRHEGSTCHRSRCPAIGGDLSLPLRFGGTSSGRTLCNKTRRARSSSSPPYPLFCLTNVVAVIGLDCKAFKADHQSVQELLHRPSLEDVNYVPLEWRDELLNEEILPMSYSTF